MDNPRFAHVTAGIAVRGRIRITQCLKLQLHAVIRGRPVHHRPGRGHVVHRHGDERFAGYRCAIADLQRECVICRHIHVGCREIGRYRVMACQSDPMRPTPSVGQVVTICIGRIAAVQCHGCPLIYRLCLACVGHRCGVGWREGDGRVRVADRDLHIIHINGFVTVRVVVYAHFDV